jgi:hypothetical protein
MPDLLQHVGGQRRRNLFDGDGQGRVGGKAGAVSSLGAQNAIAKFRRKDAVALQVVVGQHRGMTRQARAAFAILASDIAQVLRPENRDAKGESHDSKRADGTRQSQATPPTLAGRSRPLDRDNANSNEPKRALAD